MKKMLACVLMLALFLSLGVVGGWNGLAYAGVPSDRVGVYEMVKITIDGEDYTEIMKQAGMSFTLELREDGTALLDGGSEGSMSFRWDDSCFIYDSGVKSPYEYEDGVLTLEEEGTVMVFRRMGDTAAEPEPPAEPVDADITGTWVGVVDMRGYLAESDMNMEELDAYLNAAPARVTVIMNSDGSYEMQVDATPAIDAMKDAIRAYIKDMCEENNLTEAQFEAAIGGSIDQFLDSAMSEVNLDKLVQSGVGRYALEDGKLTWDPGPNETKGLYTGDFLTFTVETVGDVALTRESLEGLWVGKVDMRETMVREVPELAEYLGDASMNVYLELREDGSYELLADGTSLIPAFREAAYRYIEKTCEDSNMSIEDFEAQAGMDVETLLDQATASMNTEELGGTLEGKYTENGGELVIDPGQAQTEGSYNGYWIVLDLDQYGKIVFTRATFLGTWAGYVDVSDYFADGDEELAKYLKDVKLGVTVVLKADGSYTTELNARPLASSLRVGLRAYLEHQAEADGMTMEQLEAELGMSVDEYLDSTLNNVKPEDLLTTQEGTYTVANGRIVFGESESGLMDGVWSGTTLIFTLEKLGEVVLNHR